MSPFFGETWDVISKLERLPQCVLQILHKPYNSFQRIFIIIDALLGIICIPEMHVWRSIRDNKTGHVENWDIKCYLNFLLNPNSLSCNASISQICNERVFPKDHKVFIVLSVEYVCISNVISLSLSRLTYKIVHLASFIWNMNRKKVFIGISKMSFQTRLPYGMR